MTTFDDQLPMTELNCLRYIAAAPPHNRGGFHQNTVAAAKWAIEEIERLGRCNEQLSRSHAEMINSQNADIKRLRSLVQCCERDYNYDGDCHLRPHGLKGVITSLREENDHLRSQLARGVAHARERVGLVEDVETMRGLLETACDAWECGFQTHCGEVPIHRFRDASLPVEWYDAARQACGGDEGGKPNG